MLSLELKAFEDFLTFSSNDNERVIMQNGIPHTAAADAGFIRRKYTKDDGKTTQAAANNMIRTQLMNALSAEFGAKIPASVKKALRGSSLLGGSDMSMGKNNMVNSGRPLTARRIRAVIDAARKERGQGPTDRLPKHVIKLFANVTNLKENLPSLPEEEEELQPKKVSKKPAVKIAPPKKLPSGHTVMPATKSCVNDDPYSRPHGLKKGEELPVGIFFGQTSGGNTCGIIATMNALLASGKEKAESVKQAMIIHPSKGNGDYYEFNTNKGEKVQVLVSACKSLSKSFRCSQFEVAVFLALKKTVGMFTYRDILKSNYEALVSF